MLTWDEKIKDKNDDQAKASPEGPAWPEWIDEIVQAAGLNDAELDEMLDAADLFEQVKAAVKQLKEDESLNRAQGFAFRCFERDKPAALQMIPRGFIACLQAPQVFFQLPGKQSKSKSVLIQNKGLHV